MHYPLDVEIPDQTEVDKMAASIDGCQGVADWRETEISLLGMSGTTQVEDEGDKFHTEYISLLSSGRFLSESQFTQMTDIKCDVLPGEYLAINQPNNPSSYMLNNGCDLITNMVTRETLPIKFGGYIGEQTLADREYYLLDDKDYEKIITGLTDQWRDCLLYTSRCV